MKSDQLFVGRKVWVKPNPLRRDKYPSDYVETTITRIGTSRFYVEDPLSPATTSYFIKTLKETNYSTYKGEVLLNIDGVEEFDKREQLIIKIRKYFNSRAVYSTGTEQLEHTIALLNL